MPPSSLIACLPHRLTASVLSRGVAGLNIAQQLNTSRGDIAYNVIDLDNFPEDAGDALQKELLDVDGILSTRFIWTGSVCEGPASFYVKQ